MWSTGPPAKSTGHQKVNWSAAGPLANNGIREPAGVKLSASRQTSSQTHPLSVGTLAHEWRTIVGTLMDELVTATNKSEKCCPTSDIYAADQLTFLADWLTSRTDQLATWVDRWTNIIP